MRDLFTGTTDRPTDLSSVGAVRIFNEQLAPTFNGLQQKAIDSGLGDIDLDGEGARATEIREQQVASDEEFFQEQAEQDDEFLQGSASSVFGDDIEQVIPSFSVNGAQEATQTQVGVDEDLPESSSGGATGSKKAPVINRGKFSSATRRRSITKNGGAAILLDSNFKKGNGITSPLIVIPDNATTKQRRAAKAYVNEMAKIQKEVFGRNLKPRVVTRSQNGRGRSNAFHTEGFAVTDSKFVKYLQSSAGRKRYSNVLRSTLGAIGGVEFFLPHSSKDPGAVNKKLGVSEVSLAKQTLDSL